MLIDFTQSDALQLQALYESCFPDNEKKPWEFMLQKQQEQKMELLSVVEDDQVTALCFLAFHDQYVLLDYLAVHPAHRNQKLGSKIVKELLERYPDKKLVVEIEDTYQIHPEQFDRIRRKKFYERCGLHAMNYRINLFGVDMQILCNDIITYEAYRQILLNAFGPYCDRYIKQLKDSVKA